MELLKLDCPLCDRAEMPECLHPIPSNTHKHRARWAGIIACAAVLVALHGKAGDRPLSRTHAASVTQQRPGDGSSRAVPSGRPAASASPQRSSWLIMHTR